MGGSTETSSSKTTPNNPAVDATTTKILSGINTQLDAGPKVFNESLYGGVGDTTKQGWNAALTAANNPDYAKSIGGALKSFGDYAAGNFGSDPVRANLINDVTTNANNSFNASGLFGSDSNQRAVGEGLGVALGNYDQSRQMSAAQMLPSLYQASLAPSTVQGAVGSAMDADTQARLLGREDLFRRQNDATKDDLAWAGSVMAGPSAASGSTTSEQTPWWKIGLGAGATALGTVGKFF